MILHDLATAVMRGVDAEDAHGLAIAGLKLKMGPKGPKDDPILATELAGIALPNVVGLAPGFDKNAEVFDPMLRAGFGFVECGTVTPKAQEGNPRPRLFRLSEDRAVINRLGFNNQGWRPSPGAARGRRRHTQHRFQQGPEDRIGDYVTAFGSGVSPHTSRSTPLAQHAGLRALQTKAALDDCWAARRARDGLPPRRRPMF